MPLMQYSRCVSATNSFTTAHTKLRRLGFPVLYVSGKWLLFHVSFFLGRSDPSLLNILSMKLHVIHGIQLLNYSTIVREQVSQTNASYTFRNALSIFIRCKSNFWQPWTYRWNENLLFFFFWSIESNANSLCDPAMWTFIPFLTRR